MIALPQPTSDRPSVLGFSIPKAGSTLLFALLRGLSRRADLVYVSVANSLRQQGVIETQQAPLVHDLFLPQGYCYGGFRGYPRYPLPIVETVQSVVLVRDPLDMLVSNYFSAAYSHRPPGGPEDGPAMRRFLAERQAARESSVDDWALSMAPYYRMHFDGLLPLLSNPRARLWRYEDVIFDKLHWAQQMAEHLGWSIPRQAVEAIVQRHDVLPEREDREAHVRQAKPGNWRQHLGEATAARIQAVLKPSTAPFGY